MKLAFGEAEQKMIIWIGFFVFIFILLALDLVVFHKKPAEVKTEEALIWSGVWVVISLSFNVFVFAAFRNHWMAPGPDINPVMAGKDAFLKFFTGYILEKSLSVDNLFVMAMIFGYFEIPSLYQHKILFWGILGALIFRGLMIFCGVELIEHFSWISYVFGGLLIISAVKMGSSGQDDINPHKNPALNFLKRTIHIVDDFSGGKFFVRHNRLWAITPIFVVLVVIETTDIMFAFDSIPAVLAVTTNGFIVFTSNVFAILGLRSLYFVLASVMDKFQYLKISLVFVLSFVGLKMLLFQFIKLPILGSLAIIAGILATGVLASVITGNRKPSKILSAMDVVPAEKEDIPTL